MSLILVVGSLDLLTYQAIIRDVEVQLPVMVVTGRFLWLICPKPKHFEG